jgi:hypothetical protein
LFATSSTFFAEPDSRISRAMRSSRLVTPVCASITNRIIVDFCTPALICSSICGVRRARSSPASSKRPPSAV